MGRKDKDDIFMDHLHLVIDDKMAYVRGVYRDAVTDIKDTPVILKTKNLLALYDELKGKKRSLMYDENFIEQFCQKRNISKSNYLRLVALCKMAFGIKDDKGNTVKKSSTNRKYICILILYSKLHRKGVDAQEFCNKTKISRATFLRYLLLVEKYLKDEYDEVRLSFDEDRRYKIVNINDY